ncbi:hypothetical protein [Halochromatium roseum]|uniref:hypothetical protein n=1 Tax=Halochromatium roseum TaxID=391920 RepID=UPI001914BAB9|nr:hypothetical protein [Halochromatium roseum]MBK5938745.1 hypothetical protein [Halochromatium roseum]
MPAKPFADNKPPIQALLLDMDGILYHGNSLLAGAAALLRRIEATQHLFLTNNQLNGPSKSRSRIAT